MSELNERMQQIRNLLITPITDDEARQIVSLLDEIKADVPAAPAPQPAPSGLEADTGARLRIVCRMLGITELPDSDQGVYDVAFAVLGMVRRDLEKREAVTPAAPSELRAAILGMACNEMHAGSPNADVRRAFGDGYRRAREEAADLVAVAPASPQQAQADARDAARWRAFVGSARIKPQGSAGLNEPLADNYAHMGLEIWTTYDRDFSVPMLERMDRETALGRDWLTKYADVAVAAIAAATTSTEGR
jgi:hypothetical protein